MGLGEAPLAGEIGGKFGDDLVHLGFPVSSFGGFKDHRG